MTEEEIEINKLSVSYVRVKNLRPETRILLVYPCCWQAIESGCQEALETTKIHGKCHRARPWD